MTVANAIAMWQKGGTQVKLSSSATAGGTPDLILHDDVSAIMPDPAKAVIRRNLNTGGGPQPRSQDHVLGRPRANVGQLRLPLTPINLALAFQSLLQDVTYSTDHYALGAYATPATSKWLYVESGVAGADTVGYGFGGRVTKITIDIPPVTDEDPGNPMLICDVVFLNATRNDAFTGGGSPSTDTAEPFTGLDLTFSVAGATTNIIGGQIMFDAGVTKAKAVNASSATPLQLYAGPLVISGNVRAYASTSGSDAHQTLITNHDSKTDVEVGLTIDDSTDHTITFDALIEAPEAQEEDGMVVYSFGLQGVDDNGDQPAINIYTADLGGAW